MLKGFYKIEREGWGGERGGREGVGGRRRERQGNTGSNRGTCMNDQGPRSRGASGASPPPPPIISKNSNSNKNQRSQYTPCSNTSGKWSNVSLPTKYALTFLNHTRGLGQ